MSIFVSVTTQLPYGTVNRTAKNCQTSISFGGGEIGVSRRAATVLGLLAVGPAGRFPTMRKKLGTAGIVLGLVVFCFTGCASTAGRQEIMVERPDASSEGANSSPVPGEHIPDDGRVTPGATGSNASVHW
jgi:hypothetical protein